MHRTLRDLVIAALSILALWGCGSSDTETPAQPDPAPAAEAAPAPAPASRPQLSLGAESACVRLASGSARCWGRNGSGQLGDGATAPSSVAAPVAVAGLEDVLQIETAGERSCALLEGGAVRCWGGNAHGAIGDGTNEARLAPTAVSGITNATQISLGHGHGCARLSDGTARCWGFGMSGVLGDGGNAPQSTPVEVRGLTGVEEVAAGASHNCARLRDGTVSCWGSNSHGQSGEGAPMDQTTPRAVPGLTGVVQLAAAAQHTCARLQDGGVRCWGANDHGQLGDGTTDARTAPVAVVDVTGATDIAVGGGYGVGYSCALVAGGAAKCWGRGLDGALGDGNGEEHDAPRPVDVAGLSGAVDLAVGGNNMSAHACAARADGSVVCWGSAQYIGVPPAYGERYLAPHPIAM